MKLAKITIYSHFFKVENIHPHLYNSVITLCMKELLQMKIVKIRGRYKREKGKIYMARTNDRSVYRLHIHYLNRFKELMKGNRITEDEIEWVNAEGYEPDEVSIQMPDSVVLRDYQEELVDYVLDDGNSKLITLPTGTGKTFTALKASEMLSKRLLVMVLGRYLEKWEEDVKGAYGDDNDKIAIVRGNPQLMRLLELAKAGKPLPDVIVVSITTMQRYIKEWEMHQGKEIDGMIPPEEIYSTLRIGTRIIDEAHQHFHAVFKNDLYTHGPKCIYLTATLDTNDRFQQFLYYLMWPLDIRKSTIKAPAYDRTLSIHYYHQRPDRIRCTGSQGYSHLLYEKSIWRHVPSRCQYLDMIGDVVEKYFLPLYEPGKKMLIFCAMVETCQYVAEYLKKRFSEQNWKISKFTAEDSKEVIDTNDITISTLGKSGTALDVAGLVICLMTVALSEPKANKQAKGRLRDLSRKPGFEHIEPLFCYFCADDIDRHVVYDKEKKKLFASITKEIRDETVPYVIGEPMHDYFGSGHTARWEAWGVKKETKSKE